MSKYRSKSCIVPNCRNNYDTPGVTFHRLGKKRRISWLKAIGRLSEKKELNAFNVICSKHFVKKDFELVNKRIVLKKKAVPKLFLPKHAMSPPFTHKAEPGLKKRK